MKRSEMVDKLTKLLFKQTLKNQPIYNIEKDDFEHFEKLFKRDAKQILKLIEKEGMQPPEVVVEEPDNDNGCIEEGSRSFVRNEWESEDD